MQFVFFFFRYSVVDLKRPISVFAEKPSIILVLLKHTPNPSSQFIDLDIEIPFSRGTLANNESTLYGAPKHVSLLSLASKPNKGFPCGSSKICPFRVG